MHKFKKGFSKEVRFKYLMSAFIYAFIVFLFLFSAVKYVKDQEKYYVRNIERNFRLILEARAHDIDKWLSSNFNFLNKLSDNPAVSLYLMRMVDQEAFDDGMDVEGQYLANLITTSEYHLGIHNSSNAAYQVGANADIAPKMEGIYFLDQDMHFIVGNLKDQKYKQMVKEIISRKSSDGEILVDIYENDQKDLFLGFAVPIYRVHADKKDENIIGYMLLVKEIEQIDQYLEHPGEVYKSVEHYIVRLKDNFIEYIKNDDSEKGIQRISFGAFDNLNLKKIILDPAFFGIVENLEGNKVLASGIQMKNAPWHIVRSVSRREALSEIDSKVRNTLIIFILIILATAFAFVAVWKYGATKRTMEANKKLKDLSKDLSEYIEFMHKLANDIPDEIFVLDQEGKIEFANKKFVRDYQKNYSDVVGKKLALIIGKDKAEIYEDLNKKALKKRDRVYKVHKFEENGVKRFVHSSHVPMADHKMLVTLHDFSYFMAERERKDEVVEDLIEFLVTVIGLKKPKHAREAKYVKDIALMVADSMGISDSDRRSLKLASYLINIDQYFVHSNFEVKNKREKVLKVLDKINFDVPVVKVLSQIDLRWDGNKGQKMSGDDILLAARILAVAYEFVTRVRLKEVEPENVKEIADSMMRESGKIYDPKVMAQFLNIIHDKKEIKKIIKIFKEEDIVLSMIKEINHFD
jgi:HD-GYP domain-containing protein (c-di-GMP phosphodiesterase class II)